MKFEQNLVDLFNGLNLNQGGHNTMKRLVREKDKFLKLAQKHPFVVCEYLTCLSNSKSTEDNKLASQFLSIKGMPSIIFGFMKSIKPNKYLGEVGHAPIFFNTKSHDIQKAIEASLLDLEFPVLHDVIKAMPEKLKNGDKVISSLAKEMKITSSYDDNQKWDDSETLLTTFESLQPETVGAVIEQAGGPETLRILFADRKYSRITGWPHFTYYHDEDIEKIRDRLTAIVGGNKFKNQKRYQDYEILDPEHPIIDDFINDITV